MKNSSFSWSNYLKRLLWSLLMTEAMLVSVVYAATEDHANVHDTCFYCKPRRYVWSVIQPEVVNVHHLSSGLKPFGSPLSMFPWMLWARDLFLQLYWWLHTYKLKWETFTHQRERERELRGWWTVEKRSYWRECLKSWKRFSNVAHHSWWLLKWWGYQRTRFYLMGWPLWVWQCYNEHMINTNWTWWIFFLLLEGGPGRNGKLLWFRCTVWHPQKVH